LRKSVLSSSVKIAVPKKREQHLRQNREETFVAANPYSVGLDQNPANYVPLSPLSFLERSAFVYPKRISIIQGDRQYTWKESYDRCRQLASALKIAASARAIRSP
jgi:hypothetical protein